MRQAFDNKGFSLVEVIVASAILALIAIMMVSAFMTMTTVSQKTSDSKSSDSELEAAIAAETGGGGYTKATAAGASTLSFISEGTTYNLPLDANKYSSDETGSSFTVFEFKPTTP